MKLSKTQRALALAMVIVAGMSGLAAAQVNPAPLEPVVLEQELAQLGGPGRLPAGEQVVGLIGGRALDVDQR